MAAKSLVDLVKRLAAEDTVTHPIEGGGCAAPLPTRACGKSEISEIRSGGTDQRPLNSLNSLISPLHTDKSGLDAGRDRLEERAGIVEYDTGAPREWAEGLARLEPDKPARCPRKRWLMFLDDCDKFVDQWAKQAVVMGWRAHDLFGCDAPAPFARLDRTGLLWLVAGDDIVLLTADIAVIRRPSGARLTHWRLSSDGAGRVLVWQLVE